MLFNSPAFLFLFLPITLVGFYAVAHLRGRNAGLAVLLSASLVFYAYSSLFNFLLFIGSVVANFVLGHAVAQYGRGARKWLLAGIALNLAFIGYFKYTGLLVASLNDLLSTS